MEDGAGTLMVSNQWSVTERKNGLLLEANGEVGESERCEKLVVSAIRVAVAFQKK
jgi:hypothetical protein